MESVYDIYTQLLLEDLKGCLLDKPFVDYFMNRYPGRISVYPRDFDTSNFGFGFQKNAEGEKLVKEFNEFLSKTDIDALYYKWTHSKPKELHIDTNLTTNENTKMLNVALIMDFIPLYFYHFEEPKGYEYELIYLFAKEYNYQINFTKLENDSQRMTYLTEGKANITGGHFTITERRKESIHFSQYILKATTVFTVTTDSKKEFLTTIVLDENYEEKPNNNFEFKAKFSNAIKDVSCIIPKQFNDTILANCTLYNITDIDPYNQGFEYGNSSDHIKFVYYSFNASTLLKANELIPNSNVITETDKSKNILSKDDNANEEDLRKYHYFRQNTKNSLSAGAIVLRVICSAIAVAAVIAVVFISKRVTSPATSVKPNFENSEIRKI